MLILLLLQLLLLLRELVRVALLLLLLLLLLQVGFGMLAAALLPVGFSIWISRGAGTPNLAYALQSIHQLSTCKQQQQQQQPLHIDSEESSTINL